MRHTPFLHRFLRDEDGAVTIDWVVLTAALIGLCLSIFVFFGDGVGVVGGEASAHLEDIGSKIETGTILNPW
ncbi:MAG: hypothetical protein AAFQ54_03525 [Pseudomonadota bacterium]